MQNKTIENYKIISLLGKGGMGSVYKAYDMKLDRFVAIKILNSKIVDQPHFIERFKREAKNQAQLVHPNIVTVYGFIETADTLGIVMEYVEGECIDKLIYDRGKIHIFDAVYMMRQILAGIGYAHSKGFVHRDIKPSNIIFNREEGITKIMDFGISKSLVDKGMTKTSAKVGTVLYMSPEQIRGETISHKTDIYSLGVTFYEMLTGAAPFEFDSEYEVMEAHVKSEFPKLENINGIPKEVNEVIEWAVRKNPSERYYSCDEFYKKFEILDPYLDKIRDMHRGKKKERNPFLVKTYSVLSFVVFSILFVVMAYFVYGKVHQMLSGNELDKFKKYSFDILFEDDIKMFSERKILKSGVNSSIEKLFFNDSYSGTAICKDGLLIKTVDGGQTWEKDSIENKSVIRDFVKLKNGKEYIVGEQSTFLSRIDEKSDWQKRIIKGKQTLNRIYFKDSRIGFILGSKGFLLRTEDSGTSWEEIHSGSEEFLYDIKFAGERNCFIVGWNGTVLKSTDKGRSWSKIESFTNKYLKSICFKDKELGVIVGAGGEIFKTSNGGDNWTSVKLDQNVPMNKVVLHKGHFIAVGDKGVVLVSDDGHKWMKFELGVFVKINDIFVTENDKVYIVGSNGTIIKM
ncbi:MAG: protein kinase [Melioribacteraceae bacterium]|nr:protein kinase [Melioribacteraceae bacterium]